MPSVPAEIWLNILELACAVPTFDIKDEDTTMTTLPAFSEFRTNLIQPRSCNHLLQVLPTRRSIVLVCKLWYNLGISILYSNLVFTQDSVGQAINQLNSLFGSCPVFGTYVKRVYLPPFSVLPPPAERVVQILLSRCTRLESLSGNIGLCGLIPSSRKLIKYLGFWGGHTPTFQLSDLEIFTKLECLVLCGSDYFPLQSIALQKIPLQLPRLHTLNIVKVRPYNTHEQWTIGDNWKFPSLHTLHLSGLPFAMTYGFIRVFHLTITSLRVCYILPTEDIAPSEIILPKLTQLELHAFIAAADQTHVTIHTISSALISPNLSTFQLIIPEHIMNIYQSFDDDVRTFLEGPLLERYPTIKKYKISDRRSQLIDAPLLAHELRSRGFVVEFTD